MMKQMWIVLACVGLIVGFSGCSQDTDEISAEIDAKVGERTASLVRLSETLNTRISKIEEENAHLRAEVARLTKLTTEQIADKAKEAVEEKVKVLVSDMLEEKGAGAGGVAQIMSQDTEQRFEQNFVKSMENYEAKKKAEEEARRQAQREEWEQRRQEREEQRIAETAERLSLTDDQAVKLAEAEKSMRDAVRVAFEKMREDGNFDRDAMRETIETMRETQTQVLGEFLNEEQLATYTKEQENRFSFGGRGGRGRGGPGGGGGGR